MPLPLWLRKPVLPLPAAYDPLPRLSGRSRFGWRGRTAVRVLYAGSLLLLMAYVGSRLVLEVILVRPS